MIWIQTGLAMVIFSAALRGIPKEMLEAARIDGASELKIFTAIIIPYLEKTILKPNNINYPLSRRQFINNLK